MTLKTKLVIGGIVAAVGIVGTGTFLVLRLRAKVIELPPVAQAPVPFDPANAETVRFANSNFDASTGFYIQQIALNGDNPLNTLGIALLSDRDTRFTNYLDAESKRTPDSSPAGYIKSLVDPGRSGSGDYLKTVGSKDRPLQACRVVRQEFTNNSPFLGHRIRVSGWVKTKDVVNWAGFSALVLNSAGHIFSDGDMNGAPIQGTTDWQEVDRVTDIPAEPCEMYFGPFLYGTGELWTDDFKMETVASDTPVNDDRLWHIWSPNPNDYSATTDPSTTHGGHATLCLAYTPTGAAPKGSWMWWGQCMRTPERFCGHTVRMTLWTKTEKVTGSIRPNLRPKGAKFELLAKDSLVGRSQPKGTTAWTKRVVTCVIPPATQCLDTGCAFTGSGKVWLDMKSLTYEIAD